MREHSTRALYLAERLQAVRCRGQHGSCVRSQQICESTTCKSHGLALQAGHRVLHPGLKSHPQHELFQRLSNKGGYGAGGLLTLDLGTTARANALMEALQNDHGFGLMAVSLGCVNMLARVLGASQPLRAATLRRPPNGGRYFDTLMSCSAASTSSELSATELEAAGISPGMLRMSIGLTGSIEQRWQQLSSALKVLDAAADGPDPKWVKLE